MTREAVGVRTDTVNIPASHEHVIALKLSDDTVLSQGEIVGVIQDGEAIHMNGQPIHIHRCPHCGAYPYLTVPVAS